MPHDCHRDDEDDKQVNTHALPPMELVVQLLPLSSLKLRVSSHHLHHHHHYIDHHDHHIDHHNHHHHH